MGPLCVPTATVSGAGRLHSGGPAAVGGKTNKTKKEPGLHDPFHTNWAYCECVWHLVCLSAGLPSSARPGGLPPHRPFRSLRDSHSQSPLAAPTCEGRFGGGRPRGERGFSPPTGHFLGAMVFWAGSRSIPRCWEALYVENTIECLSVS